MINDLPSGKLPKLLQKILGKLHLQADKTFSTDEEVSGRGGRAHAHTGAQWCVGGVAGWRYDGGVAVWCGGVAVWRCGGVELPVRYRSEPPAVHQGPINVARRRPTECIVAILYGC